MSSHQSVLQEPSPRCLQSHPTPHKQNTWWSFPFASRGEHTQLTQHHSYTPLPSQGGQWLLPWIWALRRCPPPPECTTVVPPAHQGHHIETLTLNSPSHSHGVLLPHPCCPTLQLPTSGAQTPPPQCSPYVGSPPFSNTDGIALSWGQLAIQVA